MHILMIEGAEGVARFVSRGLTMEGWQVTCMRQNEVTPERLAMNSLDLVLIDLEFGDMAGPAILKAVRQTLHTTPILVLSPRMLAAAPGKFGIPSAQVLTKPFAFDALIARVETMSRRETTTNTKILVQDGALTFDAAARILCIGGKPVALSNEESALLLILSKQQGRACAKDWLLREVWNLEESPITSPVEQTVDSLRNKLGAYAGLLATVRNYGYRFDTFAARER